MTPVLSIGSLKTSGSTTLALTLAGVAAAADIPVVLVDAGRDKDLVDWAARPGRPSLCTVEVADDEITLERIVRAARRRGDLALIDAGDNAEMIRAGARLSDRALIPVRFSPLSAYAALATDRLLATEADKGRRGRDWAFVASAVTTIPSRVARTIEGMIERSPTARLEVGLVQRAAYEAPFLHGGTLFTLGEDVAPGIERARAEAATIAYEIGILGHDVDATTVIRERGSFEAAAAAA
ncbi:chromosome partitioning protein ParA [uncultured Aureimonas sp.]|uniref:chromosome partitioning protein ParA n=1 Tax=uncultured Aureimonas sp. TaxID=1604662 RepID=UPI0025FDFFBD|nr:chromosome partitioning protein ParA [uncultured Aureimonas sp.]